MTFHDHTRRRLMKDTAFKLLIGAFADAIRPQLLDLETCLEFFQLVGFDGIARFTKDEILGGLAGGEHGDQDRQS